MTSSRTAVRGTFFDFIDNPWKHVGNEPAAARFIKDGLLVTEGGLIKDFGPYSEVSKRYSDLQVTHIRERIIVPGFIDAHVHFPQVRSLGAYGAQLLEWLQRSIFPEELKYADRDYSRNAARHFFDALLAAGTTTCQAFTTSSPVSTEEFFDEATRRNASSQVQPGELRGIVVGNAIDGSLLAFIPDPSDLKTVGAGTSASGIAADAMGNVYAADVGAHRVRKYLRLR